MRGLGGQQDKGGSESIPGGPIPAPRITLGLTPKASVPVPVGVHANTGGACCDGASLAPQAVLRKEGDPCPSPSPHWPGVRSPQGTVWAQSTRGTRSRAGMGTQCGSREHFGLVVREGGRSLKGALGGRRMEEPLDGVWPEVPTGRKWKGTRCARPIHVGLMARCACHQDKRRKGWGSGSPLGTVLFPHTQPCVMSEDIFGGLNWQVVPRPRRVAARMR